MSDSIPTILLEPNLLVREGLTQILNGTRFQICAHAPTLKELRFSATDSSTLFLIAPPDGANDGVDVVVQIRGEFPSAWIVFLASSKDAAQCVEAFRAGANAFLTKSLSADALVKSLELATLGVAVVPTELVKELLRVRSDAMPLWLGYPPQNQLNTVADTVPRLPFGREVPLSSREMNVLEGIQKGDSNKLIARQYDLAEATVKVHVKSLLRKIGASNRTQAAVWAMNQGLPAEARDNETDVTDCSATTSSIPVVAEDSTSSSPIQPSQPAAMTLAVTESIPNASTRPSAPVPPHGLQPPEKRTSRPRAGAKSINDQITGVSVSNLLGGHAAHSARAELNAQALETEEKTARLRALRLAQPTTVPGMHAEAQSTNSSEESDPAISTRGMD